MARLIVRAPTTAALYFTTTLPSNRFASTFATPRSRPMAISMRGGHDAHTMPPTRNASPLASTTSAGKPYSEIAAATRAKSGAVVLSFSFLSRGASNVTVAVSASRFTAAEVTPGTERAASSTFATHDAHDMPETRSVATDALDRRSAPADDVSDDAAADASPANRGSASASASSPNAKAVTTSRASNGVGARDVSEEEAVSVRAAFGESGATIFTIFAV